MKNKNQKVTEALLISMGFTRTDDPENDCSWWEFKDFKLHQTRFETFSGEVYAEEDFCYPTYMRGKRFKSGVHVQTLEDLNNFMGLLC